MKNSGPNYEVLKKAGRPDLAQHDWERLAPHLSVTAKKSKSLPIVLSLLGNSRFLVQHLLQHDQSSALFDELVTSPYLQYAKDEIAMLKELEQRYASEFQNTLSSIQKLIRDYKYFEMARIASRDLSGAPFHEIGNELTALASACLEIAYRAAMTLLAPKTKMESHPFVIMGMGKLGGYDLNFSSDIDLIFVHGLKGEELANARHTHEFYSQVSEMIVRILNDRTAHGIGFRVDLDLRPEGKSGVIINSLEALSLYYEVSGRPWERSVWIKGRPVGGSAKLGDEVLSTIEPFVFPKHTDDSAIHDLKSMKSKINEENSKIRGKGYNVKLGVGGIREIEFFTSAFQLIYGGKEASLRERNTLKTLDALKSLGLVPEEDVIGLQSAYRFLRRIENRLQMEEERQVHTIPKDPSDLLSLARRMGYENSDLFLENLKKETDFVAQCFERLAS